MNTGDVIRKLLKQERLQEARRVGEDAIAANPDDDAAMAALVEVYLEIESQCIETGITGYLDSIAGRLDELIAQLTDGEEQRRRHAMLTLSQINGYDEMKKLEQLSALDGHETEAYQAARALYDTGSMKVELHEIYGTIMYRYARVIMNETSSRPIRALLLDYLSLVVAKPSRLHSLMLRLAVRVARKFPDFDFSRFFMLWNPRTLRGEDVEPADGKLSLASAALEIVIDSDHADMFPELLEHFPTPPRQRMVLVREAFDRLISREIKNGDTGHAIDLLELYASHGALHDADARHSHMLQSALKTMTGVEGWRFVRFLINWDSRSLRDEDFMTTTNTNGETIPPLASRSLSHFVALVRADVERHRHLAPHILDVLDGVLSVAPEHFHEQIVRYRATLMRLMDMQEEALERMSQLAAEGKRTTSFWLDFADIATDRHLKLGLLALGALQLEDRAESEFDTDRQRLMLNLALLLHQEGDDDGAATELERYRSTCVDMAAEPMPRYGAIKNTLGADATPRAENRALYHRLAADALAVIYNNIPSTPMCIIKTDGTVHTAVASEAPPVPVDTVLWPDVSNVEPGSNIEVKQSGGKILLIRRCEGEKFASLDERYGVVTSPHSVQLLRHPASLPCDNNLPRESVVKIKTYQNALGDTIGISPTPLPLADALEKLEKITAAIYSVEPGRAGFTTGKGGESGVLATDEAQSFAPGDVVNLYVYRDRHRNIKVITARKAKNETCPAVKDVSGPVHRVNGVATMRDVTIPSHLLEKENIDNDIYATCRAVYCPGDDGKWLAISLKAY